MDMLVAGALVGLALFVFGTLALLLALLKLVFWLVWLPLRLLIAVPLFLIKLVLGVAFGVVLVPVLAVGALVLVVVGTVALLVPLAPFLVLGILLWALLRRGQPSSTVPAVPTR